MALRTVTMAELRLEVLLEAENSGESPSRSGGRHRGTRGSVAAAEALTGADRRRDRDRDLSHAAGPSALGRASHPRRADARGLGAAGGVDDPPSAAAQSPDRRSATAPT